MNSRVRIQGNSRDIPWNELKFRVVFCNLLSRVLWGYHRIPRSAAGFWPGFEDMQIDSFRKTVSPDCGELRTDL